MKKYVLLGFIILLLAACGKKGALIPPEAMVPAPIADLTVQQKGESFLVSWSQPGREEGGGRLRDLAGFRVFRREVLPPGEDCEECPSAYRLVKAVDLEYLGDVGRVGDLIFFGDGDLAEGRTYQYKAVSFKRDGTESAPSNRARKRKVAPPAAPQLKALSTATGVVLTWEPAVVAAGGRLVGYNVYRHRTGAGLSPQPLNSSPLTDARFEDLRLERGAKYGYGVRTVVRMGEETVESGLSSEVAGALAPPQ